MIVCIHNAKFHFFHHFNSFLILFSKDFSEVFRKTYYIHIGKIKNKISLKDKMKK